MNKSVDYICALTYLFVSDLSFFVQLVCIKIQGRVLLCSPYVNTHDHVCLLSLHFQLREIKAEQKRAKQEKIDAEMKAQRQREREIRLKVRVLFVFL